MRGHVGYEVVRSALASRRLICLSEVYIYLLNAQVCGSRDDGDGVLSPSALRVYGVSTRSLTGTVCLFLCDLCPCLSTRDFDETSTWVMRQSEGSILYQSPAAWIMLDYPSQSVGSILFGLFLTPGWCWYGQINVSVCLFNGFCVIVFLLFVPLVGLLVWNIEALCACARAVLEWNGPSIHDVTIIITQCFFADFRQYLAEHGHGDRTWPRPSTAHLLSHSCTNSAFFGAMVASRSRFQPKMRAENGNVLLPPIFTTGWSIS